MSHDQWIELAEIYACGALDGQELSRFEYHMTVCPPCHEYVIQIQETLIILPKSLNLDFPSPSIKENLIKQITVDIDFPAQRPREKNFTYAAISGVMVLGLIVIGLSFGIAQTRHQLIQYEDVASQLTQPGMQMISMQNMNQTTMAQASARLLMDTKKEKCILIGSNLPELPKGQVYQLWVMKDQQMYSAGTFKAAKKGCTVYSIPTLEGLKDFHKFAISIEPEGGMPQPTGPLQLVGQV